jgi:hypothetical protein
MNTVNKPPAPYPSRQKLAAQDRSLPGLVTGKLRRALDAMVWSGARRAEAAKAAGMTDHGLRAAFKRPHVMNAYLREVEVLRANERARTIHRLAEIRDAANNMPAVNASKMLLESGETEAHRRGAVQTPGLIVIVEGANARVHSAKPTIDVEPVRGPDRSRDDGADG